MGVRSAPMVSLSSGNPVITQRASIFDATDLGEGAHFPTRGGAYRAAGSRDMPLMLKREYDALVAANGDTPKKPAGEPERAPVVSEEEVGNIDNDSADATDIHIVSARLVGSKRHKEARARLKHGTSLHLRRDEANKHDPNAIAVDVTAGFLPIHAGFVKGTQAESLAPALDSGALTVVACTVDAPNGVDSLPTADVPVRLTLRRRDDDDASATSALELLKCPFDVPSSVGHVSPDILENAFAEPMPTHPWLTHHEFTKPSVFAALNPVTKAPMDKAWVYVTSDRQFSDDDAGGDTGNYSGKWMIMGVKSDIIDAYFVECAKAVEAGELVAAKAPAGGGDKGVGVLICYTKDFRDRAQAERSGVALKRRFGCGVGLKYKTDSATIWMYATKGGKGGKTCCYEMKSGSLRMDVDEAVYSKCLELAERSKLVRDQMTKEANAEEVITIDD
jgi:hypothetical protein